MNSERLESLLRKDATCRAMFLGVFARDRLPKTIDKSKPALLVCNTDPHDEPGEHWVVLYIENSSYGEYFDSFGEAPAAPFRTFLHEHCERWIYTDRNLQSVISRFCGHYCVFYCIHRARNKTVHAITNMLSFDTGLNDYLVHNFVCNSLMYVSFQ